MPVEEQHLKPICGLGVWNLRRRQPVPQRTPRIYVSRADLISSQTRLTDERDSNTPLGRFIELSPMAEAIGADVYVLPHIGNELTGVKTGLVSIPVPAR